MRSDDEQLETLKDWWNKSGKALAAGVVITIAAVGGWRAWETRQINQAESASQLYSELAQVVLTGTGESRDQQADALIQRLTTDYSKSVYADYANLFAARLAVERNELDRAQAHLRAALASTQVEAIELVARLRLARILNSQDQLDEALALLSIPETGAFTAEFEALRGDLLMSKGDALQAREAYQKALDASRASGESTPLVEMKLDSLPDGDA